MNCVSINETLILPINFLFFYLTKLHLIMKNLSKIVVLFIFLFAQQAYAQIGVGLRAGFNTASTSTATLDDTLSVDPQNIIATYYGAVVKYPLSDLLSVQAELNYFQKGFKVDTNTDFLGDVKLKTRVNYFEIPILVKAAFGSDTFKGFVNAGPTFGFALSGTSEVCTGGILCVEDDLDFDAAQLKKTDISLAIGAGVEFEAGPGDILIELRYNLGINDINDNPDIEDSVKNKAFQIGAGYIYYFGE